MNNVQCYICEKICCIIIRNIKPYLGNVRIMTKSDFILRNGEEEYNLIDALKTDGKKIAKMLGVPPNRLHKTPHSESTTKQVLDAWFDHTEMLSKKEIYPPTWDGLEDLLNDIGKKEIAKEYFEFLVHVP